MFILIIVQFNLTQLVNICSRGSSESKKSRPLKSISLKIDQETEAINTDVINLTRKYNNHQFDLKGHFNKVLSQIQEAFNSQTPTITIEDKKTNKLLLIRLSDLLKAMFRDANPFETKSDIAYLKRFFDIFFTSSIKIDGLNPRQSYILKKYFSKGAFNEFRTKLALFYLKSAKIIKDFVQVPTDSILDHKGFDFLIQKKGNNGSDSIMALQVKSSDHYVNKFNGQKKSKSEKFSRKHGKRVRSHLLHKGHGSNYYKPSKTSKTGILCINAGEKSLPDIANQIKSAIESRNTRSIPVSEFSEDTSQWFDTLIRAFPKKTTQAG